MTSIQQPKQVISRNITVSGMNIHYREAGSAGPDQTVTLLIHGWPTSSYLWRNIMPELGSEHWVVAMDLPGFGDSAKPTNVRFSYDFWERFIESFLKEIGAKKVNLVVHDLGGPIGLMWAVKHPEKVAKLVLLNTLVYAKLNWSAKLFVLMTFLPVVSRWMTKPKMIGRTMQLGMESKLKKQDRVHYSAPFTDEDARKCLLLSVRHLDLSASIEIERNLYKLDVPIACIYGKKDRLLLDIGQTMTRVKREFPQAQVTELSDCGHFLQEDKPVQVAAVMKRFLDN